MSRASSMYFICFYCGRCKFLVQRDQKTWVQSNRYDPRRHVNSKRKSTLSNWKDGKIDVMVGTSAFGIGIITTVLGA